MAQPNENILMSLCEMVSYAGGARSSYILAIQEAKEGNSEECEKKFIEGDDLLQKAHDLHYHLVSKDAEDTEKEIPISVFLIHVEDQFMAAETFRVMASEFVDLYRIVNSIK